MLRHQRRSGDKNNNKRRHSGMDISSLSATYAGHSHEPSTSTGVPHANGSLPTTEPPGRSIARSKQPIYTVRSCGIPLPSGQKYLETRLLTGERLYLVVDIKSKIKDVFKFVVDHLGLADTKLFGLTVLLDSSEHRFLDLDQKLVKIAPKSWKATSGWGTDPAGNPTVILHLRVQIFVDFISVINCPVSLLHYYLQLRENTRIYWSDVECVQEERCWEVAALALQADFGDYHPSKHHTEYFRPELYFPLWVINNRGMDYISRSMPTMHLDLQGMSRSEAMIKFCREVSTNPSSTNVHFYGARKLKSDSEDNVLMGITTTGIEMQEILPNGRKEHVFFFRWPKIAKLSFDRRRFTLVSMEGNKKLIFFTSSDEKSRYLLQFCRRIHQETMSLQAEFLEAKKHELNERKLFRESYIRSDKFEEEWYRDHGHYPESFLNGSLPRNSFMLETSSFSVTSSNGRQTFSPFMVNVEGMLPPQFGGQRVSMVSDASSNTTSGIVSDRQHTHDDSEAEQEVDVDLELSVPNTVDSSPMVSQLCLSSPGENYRLFVSSEELLMAQEGSANQGSTIHYENERSAYYLSGGNRPMETPPPPPSEKTLTEDDRSIGTTTNFSEKLATEDEDRDSTSSDHVVDDGNRTANISDYRLGELARNAEATISDELSSLMRNRKMLDSSMDSTGSSNFGTNFSGFTAKTHRVMVESPSSRESSLRGRKVDISELRQKTLNTGFGSPKLKHLATDYPLVLNPPAREQTTATSATQTGEDSDVKIEDVSTGINPVKAMKTLATQTSGTYSSYFRSKEDSNRRQKRGLTEIVEKRPAKVDSSSQANFDEELIPGRTRSYRIVSAQKSIPSEAETVVKVSATSAVPLAENFGNVVTQSLTPGPAITRTVTMPKIGVSAYTNHLPITLSRSNQKLDYYANLPSPNQRKVSHPLLGNNLAPTAYNYENIDGPMAPPYLDSTRVLPNSTSLQNIPTGLLKEPPNYEQAMRNRANKSAAKRRTTVANGIDQELMSQIMALPPSTSLHQAVSEPWLAEQMMASPMVSYETSILAATLANQQPPLSHVSQGRSVSTNQISGILAANYKGRNWPITDQQQFYPGPNVPSAATSGGIYSKYSAGQPSSRAAKAMGVSNLSGRGMRLNNGLSRVQSMPDHTRGDLYRQHYQQERFFHDEEAVVRQLPGPPSYQEAVISLEQKNRLHEIPDSLITPNSRHAELSQRNSLDLNSLDGPEARRRSSFPSQKDNVQEKELNLAHLNQALKTSGQNLPFLKALFRDTAAARGYQSSPVATPTEGTPSPASTVGRRAKRPPDLCLASGVSGSSPVGSPSVSHGRPSSWHESGLDFVVDPYPPQGAPGSPLMRSLYYTEALEERGEYYGQDPAGFFSDNGRFASTPNLAGSNGVVFNLPPPPAYCSRNAPPVGAALHSPSKLRQPVTTAYDR